MPQHAAAAHEYSFLPLSSCFNARVINLYIGSQANRREVRKAVNLLFTENPSKDPALAKVLKSMGLDGTKPILHPEHPVILGSYTDGVRSTTALCPPDTKTISHVADRSKPVNVMFTNMLGNFFHTHLIDCIRIFVFNFFVA